MKKTLIILTTLVIALPFIVSNFLKTPNKEDEKLDILKTQKNTKERGKKEKEYLIDPPPALKHQRKIPSFDMPIEEYYRIEAEKKKKKSFKIKENLEWLQEDIEIDYINEKEKMVEPFSIINEEDVGWDIQSLDIIERYNIGSIKNYIPVQFKVEQMAKGGFKNKIKSLEVFSPSGKKHKFYFEEHQFEITPTDKEINIYYYASDSLYGAFNLSGGTETGFSGYIDHVDLGGRHLIKLNKEGKGYVYNIYN
jgi:hypothetical protein